MQRTNSNTKLKNMISQYDKELKSEFQTVNEKIARFKNQFLESTMPTPKNTQPLSEGIKVYK